MAKMTREQQTAHVDAWKCSGLSMRAYSESAGIKQRTLARWSSTLRAHAPTLTPPPADAGPRREAFELRFPSGHVLRIPADADEGAMMTILAAISGS
jgi:hypothetical protein